MFVTKSKSSFACDNPASLLRASLSEIFRELCADAVQTNESMQQSERKAYMRFAL